jgi:hypothetical protein
MKRIIQSILLGLLLLAFNRGIAVIAASDTLTTTPIAGVWYGNMNFTFGPAVQRIKVSIPVGCAPGSVCGDIQNFPVQCDWQMVFDGFRDGAYYYHFSNTLSGSCPAVGSGTFTLLPDGTLYRVHNAPMFSASGTLSQRPNTGKQR